MISNRERMMLVPAIENEKMNDGAMFADYFMGRNTRYGFVGLTEALIENADRVYLIKGGPGTGKSTLMRRIADRFDGTDKVIRFACSSDPDSLDGVYLSSHRVALLDATPPHAVEARYPGAVERIVDLGAFFNSTVLTEQKNVIVDLSEKKAEAFRRIYRYLGAAGQIRDDIAEQLGSAFLESKAISAFERMLSPYRKEGKGVERCRQISAWGMKGTVRLPTFIKQSAHLWRIEGNDDCTPFIFDTIVKTARRYNHSLDVSYDPMGKIDALFFPESRIGIVGWQCREEPERIIRASRFFDAGLLSETRRARRHNREIRDDIFDCVNHLFSLAGTVHFRLEDIYRSAMNFAGADHVCEKLIAEIETL